MNKKIIILLIVVVVGLGIYFWTKTPASAPSENGEADTSAAILEESAALEVGSYDSEFKGVDSDINQL